MSFKHNLNPICSSLEIILKGKKINCIYFSKGEGEEVETQKLNGNVGGSQCSLTSGSGHRYQIPLPSTPSDYQSALEFNYVRDCL